jgi:hypothetical protein
VTLSVVYYYFFTALSRRPSILRYSWCWCCSWHAAMVFVYGLVNKDTAALHLFDRCCLDVSFFGVSALFSFVGPIDSVAPTVVVSDDGTIVAWSIFLVITFVALFLGLVGCCRVSCLCCCGC